MEATEKLSVDSIRTVVVGSVAHVGKCLKTSVINL